MKKYLTPDAWFISLSPAENIALTTGDISNPFDAAVAEDEAAEEEKTAHIKQYRTAF